jgi:hypothetical protein
MKKKDPAHNSQQLGNLLLRYKKIIKPPQQSVVIEVVSVIKDVAGFDVTTKQLEYTVSSRTVYVKTPSVLRTEIIKKKSEILKALTERLGDNNCPINII